MSERRRRRRWNFFNFFIFLTALLIYNGVYHHHILANCCCVCVCVCSSPNCGSYRGNSFFFRPLNARRIISQALDSLPSGCPLHIYTHRGDRDAHTCVDRIIDPTTFSPYPFDFAAFVARRRNNKSFGAFKNTGRLRCLSR